jgi:carboxyl-terminal processing protease
MSLLSRTSLALAAGVLLGGGLSLTHGVLADRGTRGADNSLPLQDLQAFVEILNRVKTEYVEEIDDKTLLDNAVRGMLSGLDPHSSFLNAEEFKDMSIATSGKFGGLGIEVQMHNGFVRVVSPIDDTPAAKAGVQPGDLIVRIGDKPVKGMELSEAVDLMRGEPGTKIKLVIARENSPQPIDLELTRAVIQVTSVRSRLLAPQLGYLRISSFTTETGRSVESEIAKMKKAADGGQLGGLILDLRNNPGGVLDAAVQVSDAFLNDGVVVSIRGRDAATTREFRARNGDLLDGAPIVVLVNAGSASASEIVAGALQDQRRAVVVGAKSFGKGSVQTIMPLTNASAIKLTTARYYTPSGRSIQADGIEPDVVIRPLKVAEDQSNSSFTPITEADLRGSLRSENEKAAKNGEPVEDPFADVATLAERDYALYEALNLLKGLVIARR